MHRLIKLMGIVASLIPAAIYSADNSQLSPSKSAIKTANQMAKRYLPKHAGSFIFESIPQATGRDAFEVSAKDGKVLIRGSSGIAMASGFNWYLKHIAKCQISSRGDQLNLPRVLPLPKSAVRKVTPYLATNYMNYCTFCYSSAFWRWEKWEREIDYMAMIGVRNPLMIVGNEIVWQRVLQRLGYSDADIKTFLPSCAFTAWWLMANLEGEGGPITQNMIDSESALAKKILKRMREYGMEPVLQGFSGAVPTTMKKYLPDAHIVEQGKWVGGYDRPSVISPLDQAFSKVAQLWYEEHAKVYGIARFYGGDLFHEGGRTAGLDLAECAKSVQREMRRTNPEAVWVLQGWSGNPPQALLNATDPKNTLVQYLISYPLKASVQDFAGRQWSFCSINNFGSHESLGGSLKMLASTPSSVLTKANNNLVGIGAVDEALETNPAFYDLFADVVWEKEDIDLNQWADEFATRRYGKSAPLASAFWRLMANDLLGNQAENLLFAWPRFNIRNTSSWGDAVLTHDLGKMLEAGKLLFACSDKFRNERTYQNDCVEAMRQLFNDYGVQLYEQLSESYTRKDKVSYEYLSERFLKVLEDCDKVFSAGEYTLLGKWIADARAKGKTKYEKDLLERSARQQVTFWTPKPTDLTDYAYKQWGGLTRDYTLVRWRNFLSNALKSFDDPSVRAEFDASSDLVKWVVSTAPAYPSKPVGQSVDVAKKLFTLYERNFEEGVAYWRAKKEESKLWQWTLADSNEKNQILSWDLTERLARLGPGEYSITVEYQRGNKAIVVSKVELVRKSQMAVNGETMVSDEHPGRSGVVTKDNVYRLMIGALEPGCQYLLQVHASGDGGNDSHGRIIVQKL